MNKRETLYLSTVFVWATLLAVGGNLGRICCVCHAGNFKYHIARLGCSVWDSWHTRTQYCKSIYNYNINWFTCNTELCGWVLPQARHESSFHTEKSVTNFTVIRLNLHNCGSRGLLVNAVTITSFLNLRQYCNLCVTWRQRKPL